VSSLEDNVFAAFVTVGRVSWNLGVAAWAGLQSETFASYVLVHHFREFRVTEQGSFWLASK